MAQNQNTKTQNEVKYELTCAWSTHLLQVLHDRLEKALEINKELEEKLK